MVRGAIGVLVACAAIGCSAGNVDVPWSSGASPTPTPDGSNWWDDAYAYRRPITVEAGTPVGYSIQVTLDHASWVSASKSLPSGDDVRVVAQNDTQFLELDRVLADGSTFGDAATTIWTQIPDGPWALYVYYGNDTATSPAASDAGVYLLAESFESGDLAGWNVPAGSVFSVDNLISRSGGYSLAASEITATNSGITRDLGLTDYSVEAWWYLEGSVDFDVAQGVRAIPDGDSVSQYETNLEATAGWLISSYINSTFTGLSGHSGSPSADTWIKVVTEIVGSQIRVTIDDQPIVQGEWLDLGTPLLDTGGVGLRAFDVPAGSTWRVDDIRVRLRQEPEPSASLDAEETRP